MSSKQYYFNIWMSCDRSWASVRIFERSFLEKVKGTTHKEAWLTDGEMMQVWHDREVVDALKQWCQDQEGSESPKIRAHPRIPHIQAARQY